MQPTGEIIKSRQNKQVVELCKLTDRKYRELTHTFRFDGVKLLEEAIKHSVSIETVFFRASQMEKILSELEKRTHQPPFDCLGKILIIDDELFDRISEEKSPEGVISIAKYIDKCQKNVTIYNSADFLTLKNERIVLLESVRDPSNIGAIIRSAAAIGIDRLIISEDCADIYHSKSVRASMGTVFNQPIDRVRDLAGTIRALESNGKHVFAAALDEHAELLGGFTPTCDDCVVIGNEGHGLSDAVLFAASRRVYIPMSGRAESFNAAVAASILMWEFAK